ncbi:MAG: bifunctional DNA primase/polymerase [Candidatus Thermoplasmatota archaeon]|nr:bifunctional DNA primase/polymerase [Candidatus Thermoplasmatota archaeon]
MKKEKENITKSNTSQQCNSFGKYKGWGNGAYGISFTTEVHFCSLFQAAMYWRSKGFDIIPIKRLGNTPATLHGLKDATSDMKTIREWFSNTPIKGIPSVNIATVPMEGSSIFDIDIDRHNFDGIRSWRELTQGKSVPRTLTELTQSGGLHLTFMGESPIKSKVGVLDGIDIIGQKHYAIRAPSVREKGAYHVFDWKISPAPSWLVELLESEKGVKVTNHPLVNYNGSNVVEAEKIVSALKYVWGKAPSGHSYRANMAMALAGYLLRKNVPTDDVKWIISELGRRTGHADHSRVVDYTLNKLISGADRVTGAPTLEEIIEEVEKCLVKQ